MYYKELYIIIVLFTILWNWYFFQRKYRDKILRQLYILHILFSLKEILSLRVLSSHDHFPSEKLHSIWRPAAGRDLNSRRRIKNYENPRARRDVYTCRPGSQEFSATRVGGVRGGGGGQIKLRREIYGRTCNEQLFHGMRTSGLASGGGISIRSSSCRPRARGPRPLLRVALPREFYSAKKKKKDSSHIHTSTTASLLLLIRRIRRRRSSHHLTRERMYRNRFTSRTISYRDTLS